MKDRLFQLIADLFPTEKITESKLLAGAWRSLFYLIRPNRPFVMRAKHYPLVVDPNPGNLSQTVIRRGDWEGHETEIVRALIGKGSLFIDAGANFGHYSFVASQAVGPGGLVLAFEPEPQTYAKLCRSIALQPLQNIIAHNKALDTQEGELTFFQDAENPGGHSIGQSNLRAAGDRLTVKATTIDRMLAEIGNQRKVGVIKSDCQGADLRVLRGAEKTIAEHRPFITIEVWPFGMKGCGCTVDDLLAWVESHNYIYSVFNNQATEIYPSSLEDTRQRLADKGEFYEDALLIPEERQEPVKHWMRWI